MATYTESELAIINQRQRAVPGKDYFQDNGSLWRGNLIQGLDFITDNFIPRAQNAVGTILGNTSSSNSIYNPSVPEISVSVNQMNLGDVLAFSASN